MISNINHIKKGIDDRIINDPSMKNFLDLSVFECCIKNIWTIKTNFFDNLSPFDLKFFSWTSWTVKF